MGDCNIMKPNEHHTVARIEDMEEMAEGSAASMANQKQDAYSNSLETMVGGQPKAMGQSADQVDNLVMDEMVDINRYRFNNFFTNKQASTCPILPKYHIAYGMPIDRQEASAEHEYTKDADPKKAAATSLLGRVDKIEEHLKSGCYIVTDDFGVNIMFDATFGDMRAIE